MAAYAVFIRNKITNPDEMATYGAKAAKAGRAGMKPLALYGKCETPEGEPAEGVVIIEFPSMDEAKAWYNSDAYQDALKHRKAGSDYRVILTEGFTMPGA
ncbi:MAG: DUF1330 domain-containing protein [Alphaproteobacteria bacterium]|nr:DUF1330 domain-containing protein [Alphaproteobacteria bacterium]